MKRYSIWLGAIVVILVAFFWRYTVVNQGEVDPVREVIVPKQKQISAHNVQFTVLQIAKATHGSVTNVDVSLSLTQTGPANYSLIKGNRSFIENMWLNIPYVSRSSLDYMSNADGSRVRSSDIFNQKKTFALTLHFSTDTKNVKAANLLPRFSFLVPDGQTFTKYSVLI